MTVLRSQPHRSHRRSAVAAAVVVSLFAPFTVAVDASAQEEAVNSKISRIVLGIALDRQTRQLLGRSRDRPTAVVATGHAVEARNLPAQLVDLAVGAAHHWTSLSDSGKFTARRRNVIRPASSRG